MAVDLLAIPTEEMSRPLPEIVNGDGTATIAYLDGLRAPSLPSLQGIVDAIQDDLGLISQVSSKKAMTAVEKCQRPATLGKYPWFTLAHIRDYLRFRTLLYRAADFTDVLAHFERLQNDKRISIVKIDSVKLVSPGAFGWRMIATDIRIASTGLLVEHYMTFREMIEVNEAWLHKVYEAWRSQSTDDMSIEQLRVFNRDAAFSRHAYRELLFDGILREQPTGSTASDQRRSTNRVILETLTSSLNLR